MKILFTIILALHAAAGALALITGSINMLRVKGDTTHIRTGIIYFYAVLTNAVCAFFLAIYHPNLFLFSLGVLSFYLAYTGRDYLLKSKITGTITATPLDWILNTALLIFGLSLTAFCFFNFINGNFNFIPLVFGIFSIFLSSRVLLRLNKKTNTTTSVTFLRAHIGSMVGSYITIFSAFLVVNNHDYFPVWLGWFGPSIIFVPFIAMWNKKYAAASR